MKSIFLTSDACEGSNTEMYFPCMVPFEVSVPVCACNMLKVSDIYDVEVIHLEQFQQNCK